MERRKWQAITAVAILGWSAVPRPVCAATPSAEPTLRIRVRVDDKAGVQGVLLKLAQARAAEVFAMSGIGIDWIDGAEASRLKLAVPYTILIMAEAPSKLKAEMDRIGTDVMGQGAPFIGRAYIYYNRVVAFRPIPPRNIVTTLGDVMAHELGHLILPPGHSTVGIMRPTLNMMSRRVETFTELEGEQLRTLLRQRANVANTEHLNSEPEPNSNVNTN
jgi:hypothetical protein